MAATAETSAQNSAPAIPAAILARPATAERRMADAIRALAIDAVAEAGVGDLGMPMGMADAATALWTRFHKFDSADPHWPDRDRFILSAGHGAMLLYALLHLTGHAGMGIAALKRFRQLHAATAGTPSLGDHPAIEATTGPPGQGLATAIGLALAERMMAARFGRSLVDHRTWVVIDDADLTQGISHEAACLAGRFRLEKLAVLWNDNSPTADGGAEDDSLRRFAAANWAVKRVDGQDAGQIASALSMAMRSKRPTLIACRAAIGASIGDVGGDATRAGLGWEYAPFEIPEEVAVQWHRAGARGAGARRGWLKRLARHTHRAEFERAVSGRLPDEFHEAIAALKAGFAQSGAPISTHSASIRAIEALLPAVPELVCGGAATGSALPSGHVSRSIHWGDREHGMAAAVNGLALHGGLIAGGGSSLAGSDYMRPSLRLAALMKLRLIHVLTDDSIGPGVDGVTRQPVEQLASLRATPNLHVFRPADAIEAAECWELALRRTEGPSVIVVGRQSLPPMRTDISENRSARGGYVLAEAGGPRQATLIATGSEIAIALAARDALAAESIPVAVVSLPCWARFAQQDEGYRAEVLGGVPRFGIEAAAEFGWATWLGPTGCFIGMSGFGASGPSEELYHHFGITSEAIATAVRRRLG